MVIAFATFVFRELETALYAIISMFVCSKVIDSIIYGVDVGKMVMIVSNHCEGISHAVTKELGRGGTIIPARGAYSGREREILLCALRNNEFYKIKRLVNQIDPSAFLIVTARCWERAFKASRSSGCNRPKLAMLFGFMVKWRIIRHISGFVIISGAAEKGTIAVPFSASCLRYLYSCCPRGQSLEFLPGHSFLFSKLF